MNKANKNEEKMKATLIFDLDETVIDSAHRTPNDAEGNLDLPAYIAKHNRKNVFKDKHLPLARIFKQAKKAGYKIVILTARDMAKFDYDYLNFHGLNADLILSRNIADKNHYGMNDGDYKAKFILDYNLQNGIMFDDNKNVKKALRKLGMPVLCAHKLNKKLGDLKCFT
jgi:FMN phosphatase YigB (HAD superfamily)